MKNFMDHETNIRWLPKHQLPYKYVEDLINGGPLNINSYILSGFFLFSFSSKRSVLVSMLFIVIHQFNHNVN
jgi:hypothetical protein